jgi:predicted Fe-Mo cluster-binding NifX family protein
MKIALPVVDGRLAMHFGHCEEFVLFDVDGERSVVVGSESLAAPPHRPGLLPQWLREHGADLVVAGGMGRRAQQLFQQSGIEVLVGAPSLEPQHIVEDYLSGALEAGENLCDH